MVKLGKLEKPSYFNLFTPVPLSSLPPVLGSDPKASLTLAKGSMTEI